MMLPIMHPIFLDLLHGQCVQSAKSCSYRGRGKCVASKKFGLALVLLHINNVFVLQACCALGRLEASSQNEQKGCLIRVELLENTSLLHIMHFSQQNVAAQ